MTLRRRGAGIVVLMLAMMTALPARAGETRTVLLPEVDTYVKLTDTTRLFLLGSLTRDFTEDTTDGELGVQLDVTLMPILRHELRLGDWERERYLWVRVGYRLSSNLDHVDRSSIEHQGVLEATGRVPLPWELLLVNRCREDLRDTDGDFSTRLRYRLGLELEFTVWNRALVPYVEAEVFYDTRQGVWSREQYQAGVELELGERWRIESYFRRQDNHGQSRSHENGIGFVLKYYR